MPQERDISPDLDARISDLARTWFAEARQREAVESAEARRARAKPDTGDAGAGDGLFSWLFGTGSDDACSAAGESDGGCDGGD